MDTPEVTFIGNDSDSLFPEKVLPFLCAGFPISVTFNGKEMARPYALKGGLKFSKTGVGDVHVAHSGHADIPIYLFLGGVAVTVIRHKPGWDGLCHVIHVNPERFDLLGVNAEELEEVVGQSITKLAKQLSIG